MTLYVIRATAKRQLDEYAVIVENLTRPQVSDEAITQAAVTLELRANTPIDNALRTLSEKLLSLRFNIESQGSGRGAATNANVPPELILEQNDLNQRVQALNNRVITAIQMVSLARLQARMEQQQQQQQTTTVENLASALAGALQPLVERITGSGSSGSNVSQTSKVPYLNEKIEFPQWNPEKEADPINWFKTIDSIWTPLQEAEWRRQGYNEPVPPIIKANLAIKASPEIVKLWWTSVDPDSDERRHLNVNWNNFKQTFLQKFRPPDADHRARQIYDSIEYEGHPEQLKINLTRASQQIGGNRTHLKVTSNQLVNDYINKLKTSAKRDPSSRCSEMVVKIYDQEDQKSKTTPGYQLTIEDACAWAMNVYRVHFNAGIAGSQSLFSIQETSGSLPPIPVSSSPLPVPPQHSPFYVTASQLNAMPVTRGGNGDKDEDEDDLHIMWGDDPQYAEDVLCKMLVENHARSRNFSPAERERRLCYNCGSPDHLIARCPKSPRAPRKPFGRRNINGQRKFPAFRRRFTDGMSSKTRFFRRRNQQLTRLEISNPEDLEEALNNLQDNDTIWVGHETDSGVDLLCWVADEELAGGH